MKCIIIIIFSFLLSSNLFAQLNVNDLNLVKKADFKEEKYEYKRKVKFLDTKTKNVFVKYNPVSLTLGSLLYVYQKFISPQFATNCPYEVSCSEFSKVAIRRYGFLKGIFLTSDRLTRCTQFAAIDLDEAVDLHEDTHRILDDIELYK